jgi:hypothetical protein
MPTRLDVAAVRADFKKAAADKQITKAEVQNIIRRARRGQLDESEAKTFKKEATVFKDAFQPDAQQEVEDFINNRMKKIEVLDPGPREQVGPLKDPPVLKADKNRLEQLMVKGGTLFRNGISGKDPEQNYIGDCYLMGAMSAVAKSEPAAIASMFTYNKKDDTYTVRLFDLKGKAHYVTIDSDLPRNGWYGYYYARSHDPKELWPALLEKAFAKWKGSYGAIEAGVPGEAMMAITGKKSTDLMMRGKGVTQDSVFQALQVAVKAGKPAIAATLGESESKKYDGTGMYADHTYSVFGTSVKNGEQYVQLRNPWGESEPAGNGRDDGIFELKMSDLMKLFSNVSING